MPDKPTVFQVGNFILSSGAKSTFRIECDALTTEDWRGLAEMVRQLVGPYGSVEGVPRGGLLLAHFLRTTATTGPHLIVDDVLTTGGSMEQFRENRILEDPARFDGKLVTGAVIFARGPCPGWIRPVFQMPRELWLKGTYGCLGPRMST